MYGKLNISSIHIDIGTWSLIVIIGGITYDNKMLLW